MRSPIRSLDARLPASQEKDSLGASRYQDLYTGAPAGTVFGLRVVYHDRVMPAGLPGIAYVVRELTETDLDGFGSARRLLLGWRVACCQVPGSVTAVRATIGQQVSG